MKIQKKKWGGGVGSGGGSGLGGQCGYEWRSGEGFVKIQKKIFFWGGSGQGGGVGLGEVRVDGN